MKTLDDIKDLVLRMEDLLHGADLPRFDRARLVTGTSGEPDELWFIWDEDDELEPRIVAVTLTDDGPEADVDALVRAAGGDPVLN